MCFPCTDSVFEKSGKSLKYAAYRIKGIKPVANRVSAKAIAFSAFREVFRSSILSLLSLILVVRMEFEKSMTLGKKDFAAIEYLLRKGRRQVETYSSSGITDIR